MDCSTVPWGTAPWDKPHRQNVLCDKNFCCCSPWNTTISTHFLPSPPWPDPSVILVVILIFCAVWLICKSWPPPCGQTRKDRWMRGTSQQLVGSAPSSRRGWRWRLSCPWPTLRFEDEKQLQAGQGRKGGEPLAQGKGQWGVACISHSIKRMPWEEKGSSGSHLQCGITPLGCFPQAPLSGILLLALWPEPELLRFVGSVDWILSLSSVLCG